MYLILNNLSYFKCYLVGCSAESWSVQRLINFCDFGADSSHF